MEDQWFLKPSGQSIAGLIKREFDMTDKLRFKDLSDQSTFLRRTRCSTEGSKE